MAKQWRKLGRESKLAAAARTEFINGYEGEASRKYLKAITIRMNHEFNNAKHVAYNMARLLARATGNLVVPAHVFNQPQEGAQ